MQRASDVSRDRIPDDDQVTDDPPTAQVARLIELGLDRQAAALGVAGTEPATRGFTIMTTTIDFEAIKQRQQRMWSSGNYATIGTTLQIVGEELCEAVDIAGGSRVLDVAAGNGNASLAAARRGAHVIATDYVGELLALTDQRAAAEGLALETRVADAENLPFGDETFDTVLSTFGVMFAPNQEQAAAEMARVCRPGGKIGLANWTPTGFVGTMLKTVGKHVPPPAGVHSPVEWGTTDRLAQLFGDTAIVAPTEREFVFRAASVEEWEETFSSYYGPIVTALANLDADGQASLRDGLREIAAEANTATDGTLRIPAKYLEVVAKVF
jgi:ubiquinone/menaquinone biosynthesis C-methylase UbiE